MPLSECNSFVDEKGKELTVHGSPSFPIACYHDNLQTEVIPWHWHEELEAGIVTNGKVIVAANSQRYLLQTGDAFFINTEALHTVFPADADHSNIHSFVFHPRLVGGAIDSIFYSKYINPLMHHSSLKLLPLYNREQPGKIICECIDTAWHTCVNEPEGYELSVRDELSRLLLHINKHYVSSQPASTERNIRNGERIKLMLQYIHQHFGEEMTTETIAQSALISTSEALRCFHATIGTTPMGYVKRYRLQKAAGLLASTSLKVSEIGTLCGFQEMSYFARSFRTLYGCTPNEYRKG